MSRRPPRGTARYSGTVATAGDAYRTRLFTAAGVGRGEAGRRSRAITSSGRTVGARPAGPERGLLHLPATIRAAAPHQDRRGRANHQRLRLTASDLRLAVTEGRESNLVLLVVDASGSMAARRRMAAVKAAAMSLLLDAYQRRDKVGLITFRGAGATLALPPTSSIDVAARRLADLPSGGRTPLAEGLLCAAETLRLERIRDPRRRPLLVLVTDGRATSGPDAVDRSRLVADHLRRAGHRLAADRLRDRPIHPRARRPAQRASRRRTRPGRRSRGGSAPHRGPRPGGLMPEGQPEQVPADGLTTRQRRNRPLLIIHTGDGKGKSTAAFGLALRGWTQGWSIGVFQFVKSAKWRIGEQTALESLAEVHETTGRGGEVEWHKMGSGWSWSRKTGSDDDHAQAAAEGWAEIKRRLISERHGLYVLDEFTYPINWGWIDVDDVIDTLTNRPGHQHVIITGRRADPRLIEIAQLVTEMTKIKHPFDEGQKGQRGIEW